MTAQHAKETRAKGASPMHEALDDDPALAGFLGLIGRDIAGGRNIGGLPADLLANMREAARGVPVDLGGPLDGEVAI